MSEVVSIDELVEAVLKEFPEKYKPEVQEISRGELVQHAKLTLGDLDIAIWYCPKFNPFGTKKPVEVTVRLNSKEGNLSAWDYTTPDEVGPTAMGLAVLIGKFLKAIKGDNSGVKADV